MALDGYPVQSLQGYLDQANPNFLADVLRQIGLGSLLTPLKVTFSGLTAAASFDITTAANFEFATVNQGSPIYDNQGYLPPILCVNTLRVTAVGTGATGARFVTDTGGTASSTVAKVSDDGKTLTFEGTVTGFVIEYIPRSITSMTSNFESSSSQ